MDLGLRTSVSFPPHADLAQDLVQYNAVRAWRSRSEFVRGTNLKAWCYRILRKCFLMHLRRHVIAQSDTYGDDAPVIPLLPDKGTVLHAEPRFKVNMQGRNPEA